MRTLLHAIVDWAGPHLPGWMLLVGGMTVLNVTLLMPAWLQSRQLNFQRQIMELQVERFEQQNDQYEQFRRALEQDDPVLLQRLAFSQLRMKPAGTTALILVAQSSAGQAPYLTLCEISPQHNAADSRQTVEAWLHVDLPRVGVDYQPMRPLRSRLTRITTGSLRMGMAAFGIICLIGGLVPPSSS